MVRYTKEELQDKKMKELREIGKEYGVNDNDKSELIDEILEAQDIKQNTMQRKEISENAHDELIEEIKKKGIKNKDLILIEYPGQINISNCNPEFSYTFNGKPVAINKEHADIILKNKDFKEAE